jgi:transcriptional regulator with AAA-type ATPase domain
MIRILLFDDYLGHTTRARQVGTLLNASRVCDAKDGSVLFKIEDQASAVETPSTGRTLSPNLPIEIHVSTGQLPGPRGTCNSESLVREAIRRGWPFPDGSRWALAIVDMIFEDESAPDRGHGFGSTIFGLLEGLCPELRAVAFTDVPKEVAEQQLVARKRRAFFECIPKSRGREAAAVLQEALRANGLFEDFGGTLRGRSLIWLETLRAARIRSRQSESLVLGPTGSGKEGLSEYMHQWSGRRGIKKRADLGAGGTDAQLVSLMGMEAGALPQARAKSSVFEDANGGTVFLDEVHNSTPEVQKSLLSVLERRADGNYAVVRIGGTEERRINVMTVAATNLTMQQLRNRIAHGAFLEDLFQRLSGEQAVRVPALYERLDDIPELVEHFARQAEHALTGSASREITAGAISSLQEYIRSGQQGSGSIRWLRNTIREAVHSYPRLGVLDEFHLNLELREGDAPQPVSVLEPRQPERPPTGIQGLLEQLAAFDPELVPLRSFRGILTHSQRSWARFSLAAFVHLWSVHHELTKVVRELKGVDDLRTSQVPDQLRRWAKVWGEEGLELPKEVADLVRKANAQRGRAKRSPSP